MTGYWQDGNRAAFQGAITNSDGYGDPSFGPPKYFAVCVEDNGQGSKTVSDRFMAFFGYDEAEDTFLTDWAIDWPWPANSVPVTSGNLLIH